ncbi:MAG: hypothetical protein KAZ98_03910 [Prevotella sp.]|nr:hypothetical protein [Prevotella sp.]
MTSIMPAQAQTRHEQQRRPMRANVVEAVEDTVNADSTLAMAQILAQTDSSMMLDTPKAKRQKRDWKTWRPETKRAMWLALVLPGAGQIYNRKYWKLPIIYGGFVGCAYAMRWNNMMYHDYSQAYLDIMDDDPTTQSYNQFLHLGSQITEDNLSRWQDIFKKRKDRYRRWRDLSFFVMVGVYAFSVIDAYVDASLSEFDISPDLSMRVSPAVLNNGSSSNPIKSSAVGLQCSFNF